MVSTSSRGQFQTDQCSISLLILPLRHSLTCDYQYTDRVENLVLFYSLVSVIQTILYYVTDSEYVRPSGANITIRYRYLI